MKRHGRFSKGLILAAALVATLAVCAPAQADLASRINAALAAKHSPQMKMGVCVVVAKTGKTLFESHADDLFTPASNLKIITTAAALHTLGANFQFETLFWTDGAVVNGVLKGDLVVQADGDPNISGRFHNDDVMYLPKAWSRILLKRGIRAITGDLVIDDTIFDRQFICPSWPAEQLTRWYEAPVAGMSFNDNCQNILVSAASNGAPARVVAAPDTSFVRVTNRAVGTSSRATARQQPISITRPRGANDVLVRGTWLVGRPEETFFVSIESPPMFFGTAFAEEMKRAGITLNGTVRMAKPGSPRVALSDRRVQIVHNSPLIDTVSVTNKNSQNFYAECLFKRSGAKLCGTGSFETGARAAGDFLTRVGIKPGSYSMADGSGMSRESRFSPREFTAVLGYVFNAPFAEDFVDSLAVAGVDKLMRKRLTDPAHRGKVVAKTGTLDGVVSLSGFAFNRGGDILAFSIIANDTHGNWTARAIMDNICKALVDEKIDN